MIQSYVWPPQKCGFINSLANNKYLDGSKLKPFADDKNKFYLKTEILSWKGRKHCGKEENAGYQHFLFFPHSFQKFSFSGSFNVRIVC